MTAAVSPDTTAGTPVATDYPHLRGGAALEVRDLVVEYPIDTRRAVQAVSGVSFDVMEGETLSLVGESGCGKSSAARAITMLHPPTSGSIRLDGAEIHVLRSRALRRARQKFQMIFQDPASSLNPRRQVGAIVGEGSRIQRRTIPEEELRALLDSVGLTSDVVWSRRPRELSGGQCQRVAIARALAVEPGLIVADEPVSALDVSVQGQILNLLAEVSEQRGMSMLFISHDLAVVKQISDRVAVMYLGRLCEIGSARELYAAPAHPYTRGLMDAVPVPDPTRKPPPWRMTGEIPSPLRPPPGCRFHPRCERATEQCSSETPVMRRIGDDHFVACHHPIV